MTSSIFFFIHETFYYIIFTIVISSHKTFIKYIVTVLDGFCYKLRKRCQLYSHFTLTTSNNCNSTHRRIKYPNKKTLISLRLPVISIVPMHSKTHPAAHASHTYRENTRKNFFKVSLALPQLPRTEQYTPRTRLHTRLLHSSPRSSLDSLLLLSTSSAFPLALAHLCAAQTDNLTNRERELERERERRTYRGLKRVSRESSSLSPRCRLETSTRGLSAREKERTALVHSSVQILSLAE